MKSSFFRKMMACVLTLCLMFPMATVASAADAEESHVHFDLQLQRNDNKVTAQVAITKNTIELTDLQFNLCFDHDVLEFVQFIEGDTGLTVQGNDNVKKGYWKCLAFKDSGFTGTGTLVTVEFNVKANAPASTSLHFEQAKVVDTEDDGTPEKRKKATTSEAQTIQLGGQQVQSYTVTYTDGVEGEEIFPDKTFQGIAAGTATPAFGEAPVREGYVFERWNPEVAETVTADAVYTAVWSQNEQAVPEYSVTVENGTASVDKAEAGTKVSIKAKELEGKEFVKWTSSDVTFADANAVSTTFEMPAKNVTVKANYKDKAPIPAEEYSITVENGTASVDKAEAGTKISIKAKELEGKEFVKWTSGDVTFADANAVSTTFVMPAKNVTVKAEYKDKAPVPAEEYSITVENGTASVDKAKAGTVVSIKAAEKEGKEFVSWTSSNAVFHDAYAVSTTFVMPAENVVVKANYQDKAPDVVEYAVTVENGTASVAKASAGTVVFVTAAEVEGKEFVKWTSNDVIFDNASFKQTSFRMPANNVEVKANYKDNTPVPPVPSEKYTVTVKNGTADVAEAAEGEIVTIIADKAPSGKTFSKWTSSQDVIFDNDNKQITSFVMIAEDVTVEASYKTKPSGGGSGGGGGGGGSPAQYAVDVEENIHGTISLDKKNASRNSTVTISVTPDKGFELESLTVTDKNNQEINVRGSENTFTFKMPGRDVLVKASFVAAKETGIETPEVPEVTDTTDVPVISQGQNPFTDVADNAYYHDAVVWAVTKNITSGMTPVLFVPDSVCTRAQTVTFMWRAAGSPEPSSAVMPFVDVAADAYYHNAVLWAVENGITAGTSASTFSPEDTVSRAQTVSFLWRQTQSPAAAGSNPFVDVAADAYYHNAVLWAVENGITAGISDTVFSPDEGCTRAQIVTFLYRSMTK